ncbi:amidase family protein [Streptomyces sp. bgisy027]|uniref:amidase family protein n=1 Tax=Streptomyces sp. bgisy027 TaxID=3413770 RepID=UPI003D743D6B
MTRTPDHPDADPSPAAPASLSAEEIASAVRSRTLRAVDVVAEALDRIERADPVLSAFIEVWAEDALRRAGEVDARVEAGEWLPLAGVPIGVKGRRGLGTAGPLLEAGCVAVGATSVPGPGTVWQTWGLGRHGPTVNPWRHDRTPGGSSAGSAVAVAAGLVPLATGNDGAGSVRIPAAWCGVVGLKVGNGRLPSSDRTGLMVPGVLARRVGDAAAYWRVMSGDTAEADLGAGSRSGAGAGSRSGAGSGARSGGMSGAEGRSGAEAKTEAETGARAGAKSGAGSGAGSGAKSGAEGRSGAEGKSGAEAKTEAETGARAGAEAGARARAKSRSAGPPTAVWSADLGFDCPDPDVVAVARAAALRLAEAGALRLTRPRSALRLHDPAPAWLALRTPGAGPTPEVHRIRAANDGRLAALFADSRLLLTPTAPTPPHGHEGPGEHYSTALTWAFNLSGHPAISIPAGFGPDGCPVGLQLVAAHGEEALLLEVAGVAEAHLGPW